LRSPALKDLALKALDAEDYHLVLIATRALRDLPVTTRPEVSLALMRTFERLSPSQKDTSRAPRLAILERLKELAAPDETGLSPLALYRTGFSEYLKDFDPVVANGVADVLAVMTGTRPEVKPTYRPPEQPTEADIDEVKNIRTKVTVVEGGRPMFADVNIQFDTGESLALTLDAAEAPVAAARFLKLARDGYYNGQTIYRFMREGWMSSGSPGANDESADARYIRDEISTAIQGKGAVGLLTHGPDTGDGRFFISLNELAQFEQTIFAHVVGELPILLEGARIVRVQVPPKQVSR